MNQDRITKITTTRELVKAGAPIAKIARAVNMSQSWVWKVTRDIRERRRRALPVECAKPAPVRYKPKPSTELARIRSGRDLLDCLAWWKGEHA